MVPVRHPQMPDEDPCSLGTLAPELIDKIYSELDSVRTLGNFIITFRYVYERFRRRKGPVIFRVLRNELGPVLMDAKFLHIFPYADPGGPEDWMLYWDRIHAAAGVYKDMLDPGRLREDDAIPSFAELTELCRTLHKMNFLASTYVAAQQRSFNGEGASTAPPSCAERLRVLRAFYRRQIVCNAWAPTRREPRWLARDVATISNTNDHQGVRLGLFAAFEPWELQQVDHVDYFVARLCVALHLAGEEASAALAASTGPPGLVVARPIGEAEFGDIFSHVDHLVRYMWEHPSLAAAALHSLQSLPQPGNRESLLDTAPAYNHFVPRYSLLCLHFSWQAFRSYKFPDPARDENEQEEESGGATVNFVRDAVDLPPFGWVDALDGHYVNWFGNALHSSPRALIPNEKEVSRARYISLELWRAAGFALWDRRRVEAIKELHQMRSLHTGWIVY